MFKEGLLDKALRQIEKIIPRKVFIFFQPVYHSALAWTGALIYGFPSRSMKVIGVTGTKGKSTTVYLTAKLLEDAGHKVAAIGSLGYKIGHNEWPNTLKMSMPGRFKLQKFLAQAKKAGCEYVVLEVTSEGIKQKRHLGITFDCAVFTNLHKEHIETHGSFANYMAAKQELFKATKNIHIINADDPYSEQFGEFPAGKKIFYGIKAGDIIATKVTATPTEISFDSYGTQFHIGLGGMFNVYNCLAALSVGAAYDVDLPTAKPILEKVKHIPGRLEFIQTQPFGVVVDYAHTPDSLEAVYQTLKNETARAHSRLIGVLGAAGGGRDKWKRPEFGRIADQYCDEVILTNEDPYEEDPEKILADIAQGRPFKKILDRKEAIAYAISQAKPEDIIIITGKGSETSIAVAHGKKIPWSDAQVVRELLNHS